MPRCPTHVDPDEVRAPSDDLPARVGRFRILGELGRGGMGRVLRAVDPDLGREVAIKLVRPDVAGDLDARIARFVAEGRIASRLDHPSIVPIHELGRCGDGQPYLVMRRVEGTSLREALARASEAGPFGRRRMLSAFVQICHAVGYAHGHGVVHRDLKPENVMLGDHGEVYVVDWGIAALRGERAPGSSGGGPATLDGTVLGTVGYMAPEAAEGAIAEIGPRSDVFGLGAILFELLAGRPPFEGPDPWFATLTGRRPRLAELVVGVDEELAAIVERALAPLPADRYADARALGEAVVAWLEGESRRARAAQRVAEGREALADWVRARERVRSLDDRIRELQRDVRPSAPLDDPGKRALRSARDERVRSEVRAAEAFARLQTAGEAALALDASNAGAHALLADAFLVRLVEAEQAANAADVAFYADRLAAHDDGTRAATRRRGGRVSLRTDPDGARVVAHRYDRSELVWTLGEGVDLGRTPLDRVDLPAGSWLLVVSAPGVRPVRYPIRIESGEHWDVHAQRVLPLFSDAEIGSGWIYVPEGPFLSGGDPDVSFARPRERRFVDGFLVRTHPVTAGEYAAFLAGLPAHEWASRAPRVPSGSGGAGGRLWPGEPPFSFPLRDADGDEWDARWAVCGVSHADAEAFAAWSGARLVSEDEYEKAARGVDGRRFPWGDEFDPAACKNAQTRPGRPRPEPVGSVASDRSPYEVADLAGGMRTWCRDATLEGDARLRPIRGGYWGGGERVCRAANRYGLEPLGVQAYLGLRLTRPLPSIPPGG